MSFAEVERALADLHNIASPHRSAFSNRLKNFQRLGFPEGINTGRGKAAAYKIHHVVHFAVLLEFVQMGLTPERAISICSLHLPTIRDAIKVALANHKSGNLSPIMAHFDPAILDSMTEQPFGDEASESFHYSDLDSFKQFLDTLNGSMIRRVAIINFTQMVDALLAYLSSSTRLEEANLITDLDRALQDFQCWTVGLVY